MTISYNVVLNFEAKGLSNFKTQAKKEIQKPVEDIQKDVSKAMGEISNVELPVKNMQQMNKLFKDMIQVERFDKMGVNVDEFRVSLEGVANQAGLTKGEFQKMQVQAQKMSRQFDMNMLSVMFFGMALQRIFGGIFSQMVNTFKLIDNKGLMPLSRGLARLEAAFSFMAFSVMKAMEPLLLGVIDGVVRLIDWFSALPESVKMAAGVTVGALAGIGAAFLTVGTLGLGIRGIKNMFEDLGPAVSDFSKALSAGAITGISPMVTGLLALAAALIVTYGLFKAFEIFGDDLKPVFDSASKSISDAFNAITFNLFGLEIDVSSIMNNIELILGSGFAVILSTVVTGISFLASGIQLAFGLLLTAAGISILEFMKKIQGLLQFVENSLAWLEGREAITFDFATDFGVIEAGLFNISQAGENAVDSANKLFESFADISNTVGRIKNEQKFEKLYGSIGKDSGKAFSDELVNSINTSQLDSIYSNVGVRLSNEVSKGVLSAEQSLTSAIDEGITNPIFDKIGYGSSPPKEGVLSETPLYAENFVRGFSQGILDTAPVLDKTITDVFTNATDIMKRIVADSVAQVIADVNRALDAIRRLEAAKSAANSSSSSSTTNNNNRITINAASTSNISSAIQKANAASPTGR
jgi:hypothetical protein